MTQVAVICAYCGKGVMKEARDINRAARSGFDLYCNRTCSARGRSFYLPPSQKKAEKAAYDAEYRTRNPEERKRRKAAYHKRTYDPAKAAIERQAKMPRHVEYCRRPEYRVKKAVYDRRYRARQEYGDFAEAFLVLQDLENEIAARASRYDIDMAKGALNKKKRRSRHGEIPLSG